MNDMIFFLILIMITKYTKMVEFYSISLLISSFLFPAIGIAGFSFLNWLSYEKNIKS